MLISTNFGGYPNSITELKRERAELKQIIRGIVELRHNLKIELEELEDQLSNGNGREPVVVRFQVGVNRVGWFTVEGAYSEYPINATVYPNVPDGMKAERELQDAGYIAIVEGLTNSIVWAIAVTERREALYRKRLELVTEDLISSI